MANINSSYYPNRKYTVQAAATSDGDDRNEEASFYYPWEMTRLSQGNSSAFGAVFIVVNAALGAGLLAFPLAFFQAGGFIVGIVIELLLLIFVISGVLVLAYAAELKQMPTYEDTVNAVCGPVAKLFAEICLLAFCFGSNVAYLVIIGDQLQDMTTAVIQTLDENSTSTDIYDAWYIDRRFIISVVSCIFILPWLFGKNIGILSYTSFLAVLCCFYIAIIVTVKYFLLIDTSLDCELNNIQIHCPRSWPDVVNAIPFICFGYQCHVSSIPIYVGLKHRSVKRFSLVIVCSVLICLVVYTLTGTFGFLTFHPNYCIQSDILRNYCPKDIPIDVARGLLALVMVTSYPILTFCGRTPLDSILMKLLRLCRISKRVEKHRWTRLRIESVVWFVVTLALAILVQQISNVVSLTGGLAATFIFIFPGMIIIQLSLISEITVYKKTGLILYGCFLIILGSFIFGNSLVYTIMHDIGLF